MITVNYAERYLKDKIGEDAVDIKKVWETYREILFECGVYDFTEEELFHFDFVRQFTFYEEDEYSHMEKLHCEFL